MKHCLALRASHERVDLGRRPILFRVRSESVIVRFRNAQVGAVTQLRLALREQELI